MLCARNRSNKHLIFEKREQFENGHNRQRCIGYSPWKMLTLGLKLKMRKRCEKRFFDLIKNVVCKKALQQTPNIRKKRAVTFENGQNRPRCMGYSPCKRLSLGQKLKMPKRCEKRFFDHNENVGCKKPLQKTPNI